MQRKVGLPDADSIVRFFSRSEAVVTISVVADEFIVIKNFCCCVTLDSKFCNFHILTAIECS